MNIFVILTSYKEAHTIGKAVEQILLPNRDLWATLRLIVVAPDQQTLSKAKEICQKYTNTDYTLLQDEGKGKAVALNTAVAHIQANCKVDQEKDMLIFTDGDMYVGDGSIKELVQPFQTAQQQGLGGNGLGVSDGATGSGISGKGKLGKNPLGGVGGHPVSLDDRASHFGYYSHLFCEAAHVRRLKNTQKFNNKSHNVGKNLDQARNNGQNELEDNVDFPELLDFVPMSGYLYAIKLVDGLFPIPPDVRAEDAYISKKLVDMGYQINYVPDALAYVRFPKNFSDWVRQKTRSLGGNVQLARVGHHYARISAGDPKVHLLKIQSEACRNNPTVLRNTLSDKKPLDTSSSNRKTSRSIKQDLAMLFFPLTFAKTPKEFVWSLVLYPLRLYLWLKIYYNHIFNRYPTGMWERIESTK